MEMNVKQLGLATFAAALLLSATAFAAPDHRGGGAPHGGGGAAPHAVGGGAPHGGGGMPRGGGGFAHGGGGAVSRGGGMASFSHAATPSHSFSRGTSERGDFASFSGRSEVHRNTATLRGSETGRGLEAPRGSTAATFTHAHGARGAYGGMEHAGTAATGHDARGFGKRPANANNRPRNFDRGSYQRNASASARFHYGSYNAPHGYHYQRWTYGEYLPSMYWARDYWLASWWMFDLAIPPYGYEWVRYGDDALLVNVDTGQILQVDYGVFY
jgi:Ni/Co efflux regulator RcnB